MSFKDYLRDELAKPDSENFDKNGNSARAIIKRGVLGSIFYELKHLMPSIKSDIVYLWNGWDTPIGYFVQVSLLPFIFWALPFVRAFISYKKALAMYKYEYIKSGGH